MQFDYIIVGGGSAGCVLANRLSEDPNVSVCLLEAGKKDTSPLIHTPALVIGIVPTKHVNWAFDTAPMAGMNNRIGYQPRGKVLGGSSSINAMIYIRGEKHDYDDWAELGNAGWSYDEVLPYFRKSEHNERIQDDYHGQSGPLNVCDLRTDNPVSQAFLKAGQDEGHTLNMDFNGDNQEGIGPYQVTQINGKRCSAAVAYLNPIKSRSNLKIITQAQVHRVIVNQGEATGVDVVIDGERQIIMANREIILSAGTFQSPQILMLSGIGPEDELKKHNIEIQQVLPGVGQNLQDHPDYISAYRSDSKELFGVSLGGTAKLTKAFFQYRKDGSGMLSTNFAECGGFLKTDPDEKRPDIQLHFVVGIVDDHARKFHLGHGLSCHICVLRPKSRGEVKLQSDNPKDAPLINPNFLADPDDLQRLLKGFKIMRQIMENAHLTPYRGKELYTENAKSDEEILSWLKQRTDTVYHPVGTCKMGSDEMAVVDQELKVKGVKGLRVVDGSIMPTLVGGNTNAPIMMIAEKAADMIKSPEKK